MKVFSTPYTIQLGSFVANIINPDLTATDGVIQEVDSILIPPLSINEIISLLQLTTFYQAVQQNNLSYIFEKVTIFASSNNAFANINQSQISSAILSQIATELIILQGINSTQKLTTKNNNNLWINVIKYNNGTETFYINGAELSYGFQYSGADGIIYEINQVLNVSSSNIALFLKDSPLNSFYNFLSLTNLIYDLANISQSFTVFAPIQQVFTSNIESYLYKNNTATSKILQYHIINSVQFQPLLLANKNVQTLEGTSVNITQTPTGSIQVNNANIIGSIGCTNGVIFFIDEILLPPGMVLPSHSNMLMYSPFILIIFFFLSIL
jgi:uncharacterized surface protein with fasciclin (FAS1) repeats